MRLAQRATDGCRPRAVWGERQTVTARRAVVHFSEQDKPSAGRRSVRHAASAWLVRSTSECDGRQALLAPPIDLAAGQFAASGRRSTGDGCRSDARPGVRSRTCASRPRGNTIRIVGTKTVEPGHKASCRSCLGRPRPLPVRTRRESDTSRVAYDLKVRMRPDSPAAAFFVDARF